jgi:hypothetical protein
MACMDGLFFECSRYDGGLRVLSIAGFATHEHLHHTSRVSAQLGPAGIGQSQPASDLQSTRVLHDVTTCTACTSQLADKVEENSRMGDQFEARFADARCSR